MSPLDMIVIGLAVVVLVLRFSLREITVKDGDDTYIRELSWSDRLSLLVNRNIYVGLRSREDWEGGSLPHFIFRCQAHGYVVSSPFGLKEELRCPECEPEFLDRLAEKTLWDYMYKRIEIAREAITELRKKKRHWPDAPGFDGSTYPLTYGFYGLLDYIELGKPEKILDPTIRRYVQTVIRENARAREAEKLEK